MASFSKALVAALEKDTYVKYYFRHQPKELARIVFAAAALDGNEKLLDNVTESPIIFAAAVEDGDEGVKPQFTLNLNSEDRLSLIMLVRGESVYYDIEWRWRREADLAAEEKLPDTPDFTSSDGYTRRTDLFRTLDEAVAALLDPGHREKCSHLIHPGFYAPLGFDLFG